MRFTPVVGGGLTAAAASVETPFGTAASSWQLVDGRVQLVVTVPPGSTGEIHLGGGQVEEVGSGTQTYQWPVKAEEKH